MSSEEKIGASHLERDAYVYIRQSSAGQVQHHRESTRRQYNLVDRAVKLGWPKEKVKVIDEDQGESGSGTVQRDGFTGMTADVALGQVGLILSIEVSRVARSNAEWYRLLDLCGVSDTLIGDEDGLYHPGLFNDRLLLGLKGTMAEAELHVIRARLQGGVRNKAARGELRRGLPIGLVWGEADGEIFLDPDEAIRNAIHFVFAKFAELGSVRQVWLWLLSEETSFPHRPHYSGAEVMWDPPTYCAVHNLLTSPMYAGAYSYGRTRQHRFVDESGRVRQVTRKLPRSEWAVLIPDHHEGYIDWHTYEMNQKRIRKNMRPFAHQPGAVREGSALLQGIGRCGHCGRRLRVYYSGDGSTSGYYCVGQTIANSRDRYCMRTGGGRIDEAVAAAFLEVIAPAGVEAAMQAEALIESEREAAIEQWRLQVERAQYEAQRAERRYRAVDAENRLVARTLEHEWEERLDELSGAEAELRQRQQHHPQQLTDELRERIRRLGEDVSAVWHAPSTSDRDRKELLQCLVEEVSITISAERRHAEVLMRWRGGMLTELKVVRHRPNDNVPKTDEDTIALVRRLARHYPDKIVAGILNRQGRKTARGLRFSTCRVRNLRVKHDIPLYRRPKEPPDGKLLSMRKAAQFFGVNSSTVHRWITDGFIAGEQLTPGAPWKVRVSDEIKRQLNTAPPPGYVAMQSATRILGVSRQTVLQRVKRGELEAIHCQCGKRKSLRIKVIDNQPDLFEANS
jgi:DNA invertase Pin-like site-specific DNA recombinase